MNRPEHINPFIDYAINLLSQSSPSEKEVKQALEMIESVVGNYRNDIYPDYSRGLAGIGCGIQYLINKGYLKANADEVLVEVDAALFSAVYFLAHTDLTHATGLTGIASYYFYRLEDQHASCDNLCTLTSCSVLISILDILSARFHLNGYTYPVFRNLPEVSNMEKKDILDFLVRFIPLDICKGQAVQLRNCIQKSSPPFCFPSRQQGTKNLNDVSILIPVRIDSEERKANLETLIRFYRQQTNAQFIIWEADQYPRLKIEEDASLLYIFHRDSDPIFHHTRYRNEMIRLARTPIIAIWDTDVFVPLEQMYEAAEQIRKQQAVLSYPFDGVCYSVPPAMSVLFRKEMNIGMLNVYKTKFPTVFGMLTVGGVFFVDRERYRQAGMENEYFYGWGPEDAERLKRITLLNLPVSRIKGDIFHLWHPRKLNSGFADERRNISGKQEFLRICRMSRSELETEVKSWEWRRPQ